MGDGMVVDQPLVARPVDMRRQVDGRWEVQRVEEGAHSCVHCLGNWGSPSHPGSIQCPLALRPSCRWRDLIRAWATLQTWRQQAAAVCSLTVAIRAEVAAAVETAPEHSTLGRMARVAEECMRFRTASSVGWEYSAEREEGAALEAAGAREGASREEKAAAAVAKRKRKSGEANRAVSNAAQSDRPALEAAGAAPGASLEERAAGANARWRRKRSTQPDTRTEDEREAGRLKRRQKENERLSRVLLLQQHFPHMKPAHTALMEQAVAVVGIISRRPKLLEAMVCSKQVVFVDTAVHRQAWSHNPLRADRYMPRSATAGGKGANLSGAAFFKCPANRVGVGDNTGTVHVTAAKIYAMRSNEYNPTAPPPSPSLL